MATTASLPPASSSTNVLTCSSVLKETAYEQSQGPSLYSWENFCVAAIAADRSIVMLRLMMGYALGKSHQVSVPVARAVRLKSTQKRGVRKKWFTIDLPAGCSSCLNFIAYYGIAIVSK